MPWKASSVMEERLRAFAAQPRWNRAGTISISLFIGQS
jgi:hypothetical protein